MQTSNEAQPDDVGRHTTRAEALLDHIARYTLTVPEAAARVLGIETNSATQALRRLRQAERVTGHDLYSGAVSV